ncbi:NAD-dependent epimerase/dehydratase family protein [Kitasatospora saccharophila]|uniref:NAD-dependent epimerase/dehydratase family protein n=1 Tax=Kitasatospora saccharophila TaxID=407973 RepID=UPI003633A35F
MPQLTRAPRAQTGGTTVILLTGATGSIGRHLVRRLTDRGPTSAPWSATRPRAAPWAARTPSGTSTARPR